MSRMKATTAAKIEWLLAHQQLWQGWPFGWPSEESLGRRLILAEQAKADGLYAKSTSLLDVAISLHLLIPQARRARAMRASA